MLNVYYYDKKNPKEALVTSCECCKLGDVINDLTAKGFVYLGYSS